MWKFSSFWISLYYGAHRYEFLFRSRQGIASTIEKYMYHYKVCILECHSSEREMWMERIIIHIVYKCSIYDCLVVYRYGEIVCMYLYKQRVNLKPSLHALYYSRYLNLYIYAKFAPVCKNILAICVHMFQSYLGRNRFDMFQQTTQWFFSVGKQSMNARFSSFLDKRDTF